MNPIRLIVKRRRFLALLAGSATSAALGTVSKTFGFLFKGAAARASEAQETDATRPLKGVVVYYSGTGSTAKAAKAIHRGMAAIMDCDLLPLKEADPEKMAGYDVIGIGGPIWYFRETANVRLFVHKMPMLEGKLCFPFCTHGGQPSGFLYSLTRSLLKRGLTIIGWDDWFGSVFQVLHMPKPYHTDGHPDGKDLKDAEVFGREMAERSRRIHAGESGLVPEIPMGPDADPLWVPTIMGGMGGGGDMPGGEGGMPEGRGMPGGEEGGRGGGPGGAESQDAYPVIDLNRCVYPRCTACVEQCVAGAIDLSMAGTGSRLSDATILVKEGCVQCGNPLCERTCEYDAITYRAVEKKIDMTRCIYPECTLCVDHCPMNSIDFSTRPPIVHNNCEKCDLCWCICPKDAVAFPALQAAMVITRDNYPFAATLKELEANGRFRPLVPEDEIGWNNIIRDNPNVPRIAFKEGEEWPEMKDKSGNVIQNYYN